MSKRILILDDDADFNGLLTDVFSQADYEVTSSRKPLDAIESFKEIDFDLVVTDHRMPDMTGVEFIETIKEIKSEVPIVMVSGFLDSATIRELIAKGVGGIFLKPLNVFSLLQRTQDLIEKAGQEPVVSGYAQATPSKAKYQSKLSFDIRSFPCRSKKSLEFAHKLYEMRDFPSKLLLIAEVGSDVRGICEDLKNLSEDASDAICYSDNFDEAKLAADLIEHEKDGAKRITLVIEEAEQVTHDQLDSYRQLTKKEGSFSNIKANCRYVFCIHKNIDTLYEEGAISDELYIFFGTSEITVPPLRECPEDILVLASNILKEIDETCSIERTGLKLLQEQTWTENHSQLKSVIIKSIQQKNGDSITVDDIRHALEECGVVAADAKADSLEAYLKRMRDEYFKSVAILADEDLGDIIDTLGIDKGFLPLLVTERELIK